MRSTDSGILLNGVPSRASRPGRRWFSLVRTFLLVPALAILAACGGSASGSASSETMPEGHAAVLRLGYFPNVTHAPALVGIADGLFQAELGDTTLQLQAFNAGP
ncbi:MAG: sulfonate ABC transporter substrate-binding protein, partial [Promicromonosporaceae bacterium]|nr:sulfonate ABC transporter substrate-binding protein [Promicromonosporaceae bacterium]